MNKASWPDALKPCELLESNIEEPWRGQLMGETSEN